MKQYLVLKLARQLGESSGLVPVSGLFNRPSAEQAVLRLRNEEPESAFFIQEVGAA